MANRFPLVVDTDDGNKLKEIPIGDQLDLANSGIANLSSLSVAGTLNSDTLVTAGNATLGGDLGVNGTITVTNLVVNGDTVGAQVQSDWNETDNTDPAFILNKPDLNTINSLNDVADVDYQVPVQNDQILTWFNGNWINVDNEAGRTDDEIRDAVFTPASGIDVIDNPPSGTGEIRFGKDSNIANEFGKIIYTPPLLPSRTSDLQNDGEQDGTGRYVGITELDAYPLKTQIIGFGRITAEVVNDTVEISGSFDDLLTEETDTLDTVTGRGATTSLAIEADAFNQAAASTSTSTIKFINAETIDILTSLTATNANFTTTNGSITATNGAVSGNNGSFSNQLDGGNLRLSVNSLSNSAGNNVEINGGSAKVDIQGNGLNMPSSGTLPGSPTEGDVYFSNNALYMYVGDDGSGGPDWVLIGGPGNAAGNYGMQLPAFESPDRPSGLATEGVLIYNLTDSVVQVWNGTTWANL